MDKLAQQFKSRASGAIVHLRGRERALESFGWTGRRAEWVALACLHGGVFTRAQGTAFLRCHHEKVRRVVRKLVAQGVAVEESPPRILGGFGRVCRIHGRKFYRALGAGAHRRRRITSSEVLMRRLLSLDYVLERPHLPWLPTEPEKVAAFEALGIERQLLPQRVYRGALGNLLRYFSLGLPVALDDERAVFVYVDPGHETKTALRSWGLAHRVLWKALWDLGRKIEVVAVVRTLGEMGRAESVLANWARAPRPSEMDEETARELARIEQAILTGDVPFLEEYGGLQAALKRCIALEKQARGRAGPGADAPHRHMADSPPHGGVLPLVALGLMTVWACASYVGGSMHTSALRRCAPVATGQASSRQRLAPGPPCRPVPHGRLGPWRGAPPGPRGPGSGAGTCVFSHARPRPLLGSLPLK